MSGRGDKNMKEAGSTQIQRKRKRKEGKPKAIN